MSWTIDVGFVENMRVGGIFFVNEKLKELTFGELQESKQPDGIPGGFIPALKQIANVAALPGNRCFHAEQILLPGNRCFHAEQILLPGNRCFHTEPRPAH